MSTSDIKTIANEIEVDHRGTRLYLRGWICPEEEQRVVLVHDFGETSYQYRKLAAIFTEQNISFYTYDLRGHGRSGVSLGYIPNFNTLVDDFLQVIAWVKHQSNGNPPIIITQGVSAGIALGLPKAYQSYMSKLIVCSPVFSLKNSYSPVKSWVVRFLSELIPKINLPKFFWPKFNERIYLTKMSTLFVREVLESIDRTSYKFLRTQLSMLIIRSESDMIGDYSRLHELMKRHKLTHELRVSSLPTHNLLLSKPNVCEEIIAWIK